MVDDLIAKDPVPGEVWVKTALWWLTGVVAAVLIMRLLPLAGVTEPIAAGLGFGAFSTMFMRPQMRFTKARYGVDFVPLHAFLWTVLGCVAAIAFSHALGVLL